MTKQPHLILLCGSGGVGKTSMAASLALQGAMLGRDVMAFTIDPARRLADALGIELHGTDVSEIQPAESFPVHGRFRASMLDLHGTASELIRRYCSSPAMADAIISNPLFRTAVASMAGAEEFIALGNVFQLLADGDMEFLIVDTAPSHHALQFFTAPDRLIQVLNPAILHRIYQPLNRFRLTGSLTSRTPIAPLLNQMIRVLFGLEIVQNLSDLATHLKSLLDDFRHRVESIRSLLRDPDRTSCIIVTTPDYRSIRETESMIDQIATEQIHPMALIVNRIFPFTGTGREPDIGMIRSMSSAQELTSIQKRILTKISNLEQEWLKRAQIQQQFIDRILNRHPEIPHLIRIPLRALDISSLSDLVCFHNELEPLSRKLFLK